MAGLNFRRDHKYCLHNLAALCQGVHISYGKTYSDAFTNSVVLHLTQLCTECTCILHDFRLSQPMTGIFRLGVLPLPFRLFFSFLLLFLTASIRLLQI